MALRTQNGNESCSISLYKPVIFFSSTQLCERSEEMASTIFSKFKIPKFHALPSFLLGHLGYFFFICFVSSFLFCVCHTIYQV